MQGTWTFFAFPLNLLLASIWAAGWILLWRGKPQSKIIRFILSPGATISSLLLLVISCFWIGLSGQRDFVESVSFVIILLYVQTVLMLVTARGWKTPSGVIRWRFLLLHAGLLLAVGAGFWGAPDSYEMRVALERGHETQTAYNMDGSLTSLGYELHLNDYNVVFSDNGKPVHYDASVSIDGSTPVEISVNSPYSVSLGEDIYLAGVSETHCILQIVKEPWRYFALTGVIMLLAGAFLLFIKGPRR